MGNARSTEPNARFSGARMRSGQSKTGDTFFEAFGTPQADPKPEGYMYGILSTDQLAAALWTNAVYDKPSGPSALESARVQKQTVSHGAYHRTGIWSGPWLVRAEGSPE